MFEEPEDFEDRNQEELNQEIVELEKRELDLDEQRLEADKMRHANEMLLEAAKLGCLTINEVRDMLFGIKPHADGDKLIQW